MKRALALGFGLWALAAAHPTAQMSGAPASGFSRDPGLPSSAVPAHAGGSAGSVARRIDRAEEEAAKQPTIPFALRPTAGNRVTDCEMALFAS